MAYFKCEKSSIMLKKLIWNNPSPTTGFPGQTLVMDLSMYDAVIIRCSWQTNYNTDAQKVYQTFNYVPKDGVSHYISSLLGTGNTVNANRRQATVTDSGITFSDGAGGGSTNNNVIIPTEIYGYTYQPSMVMGSTCNYLLQSRLDASGSKTYTYNATKKAILVITMSSRNLTYSVQKNNVAVPTLIPTTAEGSTGFTYCFSVEVENGDVVDITCANSSETYNYGYFNVFEIPSSIA